MKKTTVNLVLDITAGLLFLAMMFTGFIIRFPLPPGSNKSLMLWGLTRHEFGTVHAWISLGLVLVLLLHLVLHWHWVTAMIGKKLFNITANNRLSVRAGLLTVLTVMVLFSIFAFAAYQSVCDTSANASCANEEATISSVANAPLPQPVDFWKEVYPILEANCVNCHGPRKQAGGFRADVREDYFGNSALPPFIIHGQSSKSLLVTIISGKQPDMKSAEMHVLPAEEIKLIAEWIDEGAVWP